MRCDFIRLFFNCFYHARNCGHVCSFSFTCCIHPAAPAFINFASDLCIIELTLHTLYRVKVIHREG
jgi:hypothetical protein